MMTLKRFRVTNFRSIMDSGWIDCDDVTSLVGINEAGKSNVILALWKLHPVRDGKIYALHDMPAKEYSSWRSTPEKIVFISADFELDTVLIEYVFRFFNRMKLLTFARTFTNSSPRTIFERLESPIKIAERSAVEKTFLSSLYSGIISKPPPTPEIERTGTPAILIASISR